MQGYNTATTRLFRCSMLANSSISPSKVYSGLRAQNGLGFWLALRSIFGVGVVRAFGF